MAMGVVVSSGWAEPLVDDHDWVLQRFIPRTGTNFEDVQSIVVTPEEGVWFASWGNGVACLNGAKWTVFSVRSGALPSDFVSTLDWDESRKMMWIGTDAGLAVVQGERSQTVDLPSSVFVASDEITCLRRFNNDEIWLGTRTGKVVAFFPELLGDKIQVSNPKLLLPDEGTDGAVVRGILEARDGSRWVARNRAGVSRIIENRWVHFSRDAVGILRSDAMFEASDGTIWVSGSDIPVGFKDGEWKPLEGGVNSKYLTETKPGSLYLTDSAGAIYPGSPSVVEPLERFNDVQTTRIRVIKEQGGKRLWVGTKEGILVGTRPRWREVLVSEWAYSKTFMMGFYTSPQTGPLFLDGDATLKRLNSKTQTWEGVVRIGGQTERFPLISDPVDGKVWIRNGGEVCHVNLASGEVLRKVSLPDEVALTGMLYHPGGLLYLVTEQGGYCLVDGVWVNVFGEGSAEAIAEAEDGGILLARKTSIEKWFPGRLVWKNRSANRNDLHPFTFVREIEDGQILAGSRGLGLKLFQGEVETTIGVRDELISSRVLCANQTVDGGLWIGFDNLGVAYRENQRWENYSYLDGLPTGEVLFIGEDSRGDIWLLNSNNKLFRYYPDEDSPETVIESTITLVEPGEIGIISFSSYDAWGQTPSTELEYSWRLQPLDGQQGEFNWSKYTDNRTAEVGRGLAAGRYRFEVRAQDRDFNEDPSPEGVEFTVLPPIWARPSIAVPGAFLVAIAFGLGVRLRIKHRELRKHSEHLDELVKLRTNELELSNHEVEEEKERLLVTLRSVADGLVVTDVRGRVIVFNHVAEMLFEVSELEVIGKPFDEVVTLQSVQTEEKEVSPIQIATLNKQASGRERDVQIVRPDGSTLEVGYSCAPIIDSGQEVIGCVFAVRDVSELRRLEEEAVRATRLDAIGVLAGGIAHDFNNFLTAIQGNLSYAQMLLKPGSELFDVLNESEAASRRASELTQQLLTFSKGGAPIKTTATIGEAIRESVEFSLRGTKVKPSFEISPDIYPVDVDLGQLAQVVQNLSINAVQSMPDGGTLRIVARNQVREASVNEEPVVEVTVSDSGCGIPSADLDRVFDPYFSTKSQGNGLGLSVCYSVMKRHEGDIRIDSREGVGTIVTLQFPARPDSTPGCAPSSGLDAEIKGQGKVLNILVMDDEISVRELLERMLTRLGYRCETVPDGAEAIARYEERLKQGDGFDLAILDLTIPGGLGGIGTVQAIRAFDPRAACIATSGYSDGTALGHYSDFGFVGVLKKPYGIAELKQAIKEGIDFRSTTTNVVP